MLVCGYISEDFKVNYQEVMKFEKEILGMRGMTRQDMAEVVELVNQRKIVPYVYKTVPLNRSMKHWDCCATAKQKAASCCCSPKIEPQREEKVKMRDIVMVVGSGMMAAASAL